MQLVGLTGGIATGKSSVSRHLRSRGIPVIDCDELARIVVEPGTPALRAIVAEFGRDILNSTGGLDRKRLGEIIFQNEVKRNKLNAITHPAIRRELFSRVIEYWLRGEPLVVIDAPLLIESGLHRFMGEVVVVFCPRETQLNRLVLRDHLTPSAAELRVAAQAPMADKLALATRVIDNSGSLEDLFQQTDALIARLKPSYVSVWAWLVGPFALITLPGVCTLWWMIKYIMS